MNQIGHGDHDTPDTAADLPVPAVPPSPDGPTASEINFNEKVLRDAVNSLSSLWRMKNV